MRTLQALDSTMHRSGWDQLINGYSQISHKTLLLAGISLESCSSRSVGCSLVAEWTKVSLPVVPSYLTLGYPSGRWSSGDIRHSELRSTQSWPVESSHRPPVGINKSNCFSTDQNRHTFLHLNERKPIQNFIF